METLHTVTIEDAKAHLEELVAGTGRGEEWLIVGTDGQPVAKLTTPSVEIRVEVQRTGHASLLGLMEGQIELLPGWDDPLEEFEPYTR